MKSLLWMYFCRKQNFYITEFYRTHDSDNSVFACLVTEMTNIQEEDQKGAFVIAVNFNAPHNE